MSRTRRLIHGITLVVAGAIALLVMLRSPEFARGQEIGDGMVRTGIVGIENETERKLFWSLLCTCGCPRETLGTCTCGFAHQRRDELRAELAKGRSVEEIQAAYAERFGTEALAVPPNRGSQRLLFLVPLGAIILGAGFVIMTVRRWSAQGAAGSGKNPDDTSKRGRASHDDDNDGDDDDGNDGNDGNDGDDGDKPVASAKRDDYDDKLDEELKTLDR